MASSAMIPHPSGKVSNFRMGNGFQMSKIRKRTKAMATSVRLLGRANRAIQNPTTSSTTTREGSGPKCLCMAVLARTPRKKNTRMQTPQTRGECNPKNQYIAAAAKVPAVPGAMGKCPTKTAVAMILSAAVGEVPIQHLRNPPYNPS